MKVTIRGINSQETFCCSYSDVQGYFSNEEIIVRFASSQRHYHNAKPEMKAKTITVCSMTAHKSLGGIGTVASKSVFLHFYVIPKSLFSEEMRYSFCSEILPKLYTEYQTMVSLLAKEMNVNTELVIQIIDDKFVLSHVK